MDDRTNYLIEEVNQNELMNEKPKNGCTTLNYTGHFLILNSTFTGCVWISSFVSLIGVPTGVTSSATGLKTCVIIVDIKKYKSIITKKEKKHDKVVLLAKSKLNRIEVFLNL